jgi:hypothetical protein
MKQNSLGLIMFLTGMFLLFTGLAYPLVTVVVDTTPPVIGSTIPAPGPGGTSVYSSLSTISAVVTDTESGVNTVTCSIDGGTTWSLAYMIASARYEYTLLIPLTTAGTHTFNFIATNKVGLQSSSSGSFTIYTGLTGTWYVNNIAITSTSQVVYATSATVSFKFVKTTGVADSSITCTVVEAVAGGMSLTLTNSAASTWTGSYTFALGTHTLTLKAYDGTQSVIMSVIGLQFGSGGFELPQFNSRQIYTLVSMAIGLPLMGIGLVLMFMRKKQ